MIYQIAILAPGLERWRVGQSVWRSVVDFAMEPAPKWVIVIAVATVLIAAGAFAYDNLPAATAWRASSDPLVTLSVGAGALLAAALVRGAFRRWSASQEQPSRRRPAELPNDVRAEPHTAPVEVSAEPVPDGTRTFVLRLQPHADPGIQTLREMTR